MACLMLLGMGLAVPATRMAVMNAAPPEQACIASVTMNALRQTGTSMGLALMGRLMIRQTIRRMSQALQQAGLVATGYRAAMASGFALAMATTGLVSLAVAATL